MDPSIPIPGGRNMLEELPPELLSQIFDGAVILEIEKDGARPVITSKPLLCFSHFERKPSDAGLSVASKSSLAWQSPKTCACYLKALQTHVTLHQKEVSANVMDLNFTNLTRLIAVVSKKDGAMDKFHYDEEDRLIKVSHRITRGLRPEPPTFSAWGNRTQRFMNQGIVLDIENSISKVEDAEALDNFIEAHAGMDRGPDQMKTICDVFKTYIFREGTNPAANRAGLYQTRSINLSRAFEDLRAQDSTFGFGSYHNQPRHTYTNMDPSRYNFEGREDFPAWMDREVRTPFGIDYYRDE